VDYPLLNVFFTTMWVFLWILWFFLLFRIFGDLFRDRKLGNWAKAGWSVFVIVLPFLGVFVYLIARGSGMADREMAQAERSEKEFRAYVKQAATEDGSGTAAGPSHADELAKLADLKNHGDISEEEYARAKEHVLAA
jgi:hypothetical protein